MAIFLALDWQIGLSIYPLSTLTEVPQNALLLTSSFDGYGRTWPGNRQGGGSRGNCPATTLPLTALIPPNNFGLTVSASPTLWFYVPYKSTQVYQAELILLDQNQRSVLKQPITIQLSETPGIISVSLSSTLVSLEPNQEYHWFFELVCDPEHPSKNPRVDGWIQPVEPTSELRTQLSNDLTEKNYNAYITHGIWYDALTLINQLLLEKPQSVELMQEKSSLLKSVGLDQIADAPIIRCCQVE
ncbi:MAG: DUF928 domain-containing protein [Microcoleaceae cyanobacterium]